MKTVKLLWLLQEIEKKEKELSRSCRSHPMLQGLLQNKGELTLRQADFEKVKVQYKELCQLIRTKEEQIKELMDKQKEILQKMYDGSVSQPKELTKMQQQSVQLKNQAVILEEELLNDLEEKERLTFYLKNEQKQLSDEIYNYKTQKVKYDVEKINVEQELAQLGQEKEGFLAKIPPATLKRFRDTQRSFNGSPIALVNETRLCSYCRVELTRAVVDKAKAEPAKVHCECCGRMLYVE